MTQKTSKNALILLISTLFGIATQLVQFILMGRLLPDAEIGVASIVLLVVVFAQMFTDFGLSGYYVHRQDAKKEEKNTLYWLNILLGTGIALIVTLISPVIAWFYEQSRLTELLLWCALSFPVIAAGSQFQARFLKLQNYKALAVIEIVTRLITLASFYYAITSGFGAASVVVAHLTFSVTKTLLLLGFSPKSEYPRFDFHKRYVAGGVSYGGYLILGQFLNQLTMNFDKILIGKFLGVSSLGVYTLAKDFAMRAMQIINPVVNKLCLPRYAEKQNDENALTQDVLNTLLIIGFFSSLLFFSLSISAGFVVELLYGSDKAAVAPLLAVISFYVMLRSFGNVTGTLLSAVGKTKLDFKWNIIATIISTPIIYLMVQFSVEYIVIGMVALQLLLTIISYFILIKPVIELPFTKYIGYLFSFPFIALICFSLFKAEVLAITLSELVFNYGKWLICYLISSYIFFRLVRRSY